MLVNFVKKNGILLSILLVGTLLVCSAILFFYNRQTMSQNVVLQEQANKSTKAFKNFFEGGLYDLDKSLRAFALTKGDNHLEHVEDAIKRGKLGYDSLLVSLRIQKTQLPGFALTIDSLMSQASITRDTLIEYQQFCRSIIELAKQDSISQVAELIKQDRGMKPWSIGYKLEQKLGKFENHVITESQKQYDLATSRNAILQLLLILFGLPTLFWIAKTLRKEEVNRLRILTELENSNKRYLFNPGNESVIQGEETIQSSIVNLRKAADFIKKVTEGENNVVWDGLTEENRALNQENLVGELLKMQSQMQQVREEDQRRNWTNEGLNYLGEILRKETDLKSLADQILAELIKYVRANQGILFILNDTNPSTPFLELKATYAFNRKKYISGRIEPGQGLAGQAWLEAETIYLKEIPQDYVRITSGLGDANPSNLLVVPLKHDQNIQGVLEIASFKIFQAHEISFIEKIAETIAVTFAAAKVSERTHMLLEDTRSMTEEMRAQEEEMRQNMEELVATQEELQRKERETSNLVFGINSAFGMIEFDLDGTVLSANEKFLTLMGYTLNEIKGHKHRMFVTPEYANSSEYKNLWTNLRESRVENTVCCRLRKDKSEVWLRASYVPLRNKEGQAYKILKLATDITNEHLLQKQNDERIATIEAYEEEMRLTLNDLMQQQEEVAIKEQQYLQRIAQLETENQQLKDKPQII
jgi:PAS domain S-box-containing protein